MATPSFPTIPRNDGFMVQQVLPSLTLDDLGSNSPLTRQHKKLRDSPTEVYPSLSEGKLNGNIDTAKYRNSFFHNLCLKMLQEGYHEAFTEVFNLIQQEKNSKTEDQLIYSKLPIEEDENKLLMMKDKFTTAEVTKRQGRTAQVYEALVTLAKYFDEKKDDRLAEQLLDKAYITSLNIKGDNRRKEAEASFHLAYAAEQKRNFLKAKDLYKKYYTLTCKKNFVTSDGTSLHEHACECLKRVYIELSNMVPAEDEHEVLRYLKKAYDIAKEGGNLNEAGKVGYLIGNKCDQYGKQDLAVKYHTDFLEICKTTSDDIGLGKACKALAYANRRQGNMEEATQYLQMFLTVSERSKDIESRQEACQDLGSLHNSMGKYIQSANYLKQAFTLSCENSNDSHNQNPVGCEYAISLAHGLLTGCLQMVSQNDHDSLKNLLDWKSERNQLFSNDNRTYNMFISGNSEPKMLSDQ